LAGGIVWIISLSTLTSTYSANSTKGLLQDVSKNCPYKAPVDQVQSSWNGTGENEDVTMETNYCRGDKS
jgi:hypothetical protein